MRRVSSESRIRKRSLELNELALSPVRHVEEDVDRTQYIQQSIQDDLVIHTDDHSDEEDDEVAPLIGVSRTQRPTTSLVKRRLWQGARITYRQMGRLPAVGLGLLLNLLDAVSYGYILFPLANPIFSSFGPDGISMFLASTVISQVVYSSGASVFRGGTGNMMIEVMPFLHIIASIITEDVGAESATSVVATTMVAYALSTIATGLAFMALGYLSLGSLIGFFPRHILVGCIGGVGYFLLETAIEVTAHVKLSLQWEVLVALFSAPVFYHWATCLSLAILLRYLDHRVKHHPLFVPAFFIIVPAVFYTVVYAVGTSLEELRQLGWIFAMPPSDVPFYDFYTKFDLYATSWSTLPKTIPAILALVFFGVLHVPINIPALAVSTNQDDVDINQELMAHGWSNLLAGALGTIQNYLVYSNSVLFIKSGGDSRAAGFMLAGATFVVFLVGPQIVGYIPVMVVGTLIFHLGIELLKEALYDTRATVHPLEYTTIVLIIVSMAVLGFVEGIALGLLLACVFFVVVYSRKQVIRDQCTGKAVKSTVRRMYQHRKFLDVTSSQIHVIRLQGFMFFGTIGNVEVEIKHALDHAIRERRPLRFLVLDFALVNGIDFSAAEALLRVKRKLIRRHIYLVLSGLTAGDVVNALRAAHLWDGKGGWVQRFASLNEALEWCENVLLETFHAKVRAQPIAPTKVQESMLSPRTENVYMAAKNLKESPQMLHNLPQPLKLLLASFQDLVHVTGQEQPLFFMSKYFVRCETTAGEILWQQGQLSDSLLLLESGLLRLVVDYDSSLTDARVVESVLPGTIIGELELFSARDRGGTLVVETPGVVWKLTNLSWDHAIQQDPSAALVFMRCALAYSAQGMGALTAFAFHVT
jgi:SulP family sulfate permease